MKIAMPVKEIKSGTSIVWRPDWERALIAVAVAEAKTVKIKKLKRN